MGWVLLAAPFLAVYFLTRSRQADDRSKFNPNRSGESYGEGVGGDGNGGG